MASGYETCGLQGCTYWFWGDADGLRCARCLDVPDSDINSSFTHYRYCSPYHQWADTIAHQAVCQKRQLHRTTVRVAAICNMVFIETVQYLFPLVCEIVAYTESGNKGHAIANRRTAPSMTGYWKPHDMSDNTALKVVSVDQCIIAIILTTLSVAWLVEDLQVTVMEWQAKPVKAGRLLVDVHHVDQPPKVLGKATIHAFFTMASGQGTPAHDSITVDASSMQYNRPVRSHKTWTYFKDFVQPGTIKTIHELGCFYRLQCRFLEHPDWSADAKDRYLSQIAVRLICNAIYRGVQGIGGRLWLFQASHNYFMAVLEMLRSTLRGDFNAHRPLLNHALFQQQDARASLRCLMQNCEGAGYREMRMAFERRTQFGG